MWLTTQYHQCCSGCSISLSAKSRVMNDQQFTTGVLDIITSANQNTSSFEEQFLSVCTHCYVSNEHCMCAKGGAVKKVAGYHTIDRPSTQSKTQDVSQILKKSYEDQNDDKWDRFINPYITCAIQSLDDIPLEPAFVNHSSQTATSARGLLTTTSARKSPTATSAVQPAVKTTEHTNERRQEKNITASDVTGVFAGHSTHPINFTYTHPVITDEPRFNTTAEEYKLQAIEECKVKSKQTKLIRTNAWIAPARSHITMSKRKLEVIKMPASQRNWLSTPTNSFFVVKEGIISPDFEGNMYVKIYNITERDVMIPQTAQLAILKASKFDY